LIAAANAALTLSPHSPSKTGVNALMGERVASDRKIASRVRGHLEMLRLAETPPHPTAFGGRPLPASGER
jgi:hypothetical protein